MSGNIFPVATYTTSTSALTTCADLLKGVMFVVSGKQRSMKEAAMSDASIEKVEAQYLEVGDYVIPRGKRTVARVTSIERVHNNVRIKYAGGRFSSDYRSELQIVVWDN